MSDTYGSERLRDSDEEVSVEDQNQEVVSELPSDDEFEDATGDVTLEGDDAEGSPVFSDETEAPHAVNKRSALFPVLAAIGGVCLLGGVAWWQFSSASTAARTVPVMVNDAAPLTNNFATSDNDVAALAALGITDVKNVPPVDQKTSSALVEGGNEPPAPADGATGLGSSTTSVVETKLPNASPPIGASSVSAATEPVSVEGPPAATGSVAPAVVELKPEELNSSSPVAIIPKADASAAAAKEARINELTEKVSSLQQALDKANQDLAKSAQEVDRVTNALAATASDTSSKDMQTQIESLKKQVAELTAKRAKEAVMAAPKEDIVKQVVASPQMPEMEGISDFVKPVEPKKPSASKGKMTRKASVKPTASSIKPARKPVSEDEVPEVKWVLRAASPGQAWVSPSFGGKELKRVQVGDTLAGVGRITAIQQNGDVWVIKGAKGTIQ